MVGLKLLLDTNLLIALEDPKPLRPAVAELSQKAQLHGLTLFVDEAAVRDIERDKDVSRRDITLSKVQRFPMLKDVAHDDDSKLEARFGLIRGDNDRSDVLMLDTLNLRVVDFLITEDIRLHKRAMRCGLADRVFRVVDALAWIRRTFEPQDVRLPYVLPKKAHQLSLGDPIFESLREDYPEFDDWFKKCRQQHRDCWIVEINGKVAGLVIRKDETAGESRIVYPGDHVLKICTFKISPEFRGEKLGEHLLKKVLWFAQANKYDVVYLTAYPKHEFLIVLLQSFGFAVTERRDNGECVLERRIYKDSQLILPSGQLAWNLDLVSYPRYYDGPEVHKFVVPIQARYHKILFPEINETVQIELPLGESSPTNGVGRTPGNTIRKVYICRAATKQIRCTSHNQI
ncbi:MAG: GNAT family N-acetyltransferase [Steroidobacter sp.]